MPRKMCIVCGVVTDQTRCPTHRKTTNRNYGWEHQQMRANAIKLAPYCWNCGCPVTNCKLEWHHVTELYGGRNPYKDDRRQLLCQKCHREITDNS